MKRLILLLTFSILCSLTVFGQKKIALLETLNGDKNVKVKGIEMNMVRGELRKAISNQVGFSAFTRTEIDQLMSEHNFQNSGMVSDSQRKKVGEMSGADYICISRLTKSNTEFYLEAYLINVESGEISNTASQYGKMEDGTYANLYRICQYLAKELTGIIDGGTNAMATHQQEGKRRTSSGLAYEFLSAHKDAKKVQDGDLLVGEMVVLLDDDVLFTNMGSPDRIMQVNSYDILGEGLLMMHIGDRAIFSFEADLLADRIGADHMPPSYKLGKGMIFYYDISLSAIVTKDELAAEQANHLSNVERAKSEEPDLIADYIRKNGITVQPNDKGLYVVVKKKGYGPEVGVGKTVSIDYTGRLLNGTLFDTSRELDARNAGKYQGGRYYEPLTYVVGQGNLISGFEEGIMGQSEGTILQLIIPSALGYGSRSAGKDIPPYSPLVFDIEIISVQ